MSELKEGGLALVIGAKNCQENIGKIVTLDRFMKKGESLDGKGFVDIDCWVAYGDDLIVNTGSHGNVNWGFAIFSSNYLVPINPEQDPLEITEKEQEHAR